MQRCRSCEATMTPQEITCLACGATIKVEPKSDVRTKFRTLIKGFLLASAGLTIASLFVDVGASFTMCVSVTIVLFLVLNSAQDMLIDREKK